MFNKIYGGSILGVNANIITVEVNIDKGVGYHLVGLPDNAVKESNFRIASALQNNGYKIPGKKIVINMAPADVKKEGSAYDLTIAVGILAASSQIENDKIDEYLIMGELSLDGQLRPIRGVLPIAIEAKKKKFKGFILPKKNADEASIVDGLKVYGVNNIREVIDFFNGKIELISTKFDTRKAFFEDSNFSDLDFADVKGQESTKRCMEIAAAGGHNIILIGPPGSGKTMLAKRLPSILPPMTIDEALETTKIHSVSENIKEKGLITRRPFRSPHHTTSDVALVGGGPFPQPGEISLAHNGVLFLDELPEFKRTVLEVMRQPLEDRKVTISRAKFSFTYQSSFMLVASMNPSPSGYFNDSKSPKVSSVSETHRYLSKISGPLLDRIDLHIEVNPVSFEKLSDQDSPQEKSTVIRVRVIKAREIQTIRFKSCKDTHYNAQMSSKQIRTYCQIDVASKKLLGNAMERLNLSARAHDRILKVSRTISDLENSDDIKPHHISEAIQYRNLDREGWLA